jgi:hypothetical protein
MNRRNYKHYLFMFGFLSIGLIALSITAQAQVSYSGHAAGAFGTNQGTTFNSVKKDLPSTGSATPIKEFKSKDYIPTVGCIGDCTGSYPQGVDVSTQGSDGTSSSMANVSYLEFVIDNHSIRADWLMTSAKASCPVCPTDAPSGSGSSFVGWLVIDDKIIIGDGGNVNAGTGEPLTFTVGNLVIKVNEITISSGAGFTEVTANALHITGPQIDISVASSKAGVVCSQPATNAGCVKTQGYWKNHAEAWPVNELKLGSVTYTKSQLINILRQPTKGNGLVSLAKQLIAAKLNTAAGAGAPIAIQTAIAQADLLIGNKVIPPVGTNSVKPSVTDGLNATLDAYNNGKSAGGPAHCQ